MSQLVDLPITLANCGRGIWRHSRSSLLRALISTLARLLALGAHGDIGSAPLMGLAHGAGEQQQ